MGQPDLSTHQRVDACTKAWRQGDCVLGEQWFVFRTDVEAALTEEARAAAAEGAEDVLDAVPGMMLATQTCDILRESRARPFIEVCPLVERSKDVIREVERGRRPSLAFVPGVAEYQLVADLDRSMTMEKSILLRWRRTTGCRNDQESRALGRALARKRSRFAFPNDFDEFIAPLRRRLLEKHDGQSPEGDALRKLDEIRVRAAPSWNADRIEITIWFIRGSAGDEWSAEQWDAWRRSWLSLTPASGRFDRSDGFVTTLDDMRARDYVESDPLDLDHLSSATE